jgi:L-lactate dehydrogenase complex protein LldF
MNEALERRGIEAVETDLGEFIVQLRGEPPYHIVTPAMHLTRGQISELFHEKGLMAQEDATVGTDRRAVRAMGDGAPAGRALPAPCTDAKLSTGGDACVPKLDTSAEELAMAARKRLRAEFLSATMGITGANFAIAETGMIS